MPKHVSDNMAKHMSQQMVDYLSDSQDTVNLRMSDVRVYEEHGSEDMF